jgi:hypothetical protein
MEKLLCFAWGWAAGCLAMTIYYNAKGLIRSRSEWYRFRKAKGYEVPDNWREELDDD